MRTITGAKKRGRPPLDNSVKRYKAIWVRLNEGEHDAIKARAAEAGVPVARYIREKVLRGENK